MTHDEKFAAMQARKAEEAAAAPGRVTWRKVSPQTGGGYSGLGPNMRLAWVAVQGDPGGGYDYGVLTEDGLRLRINNAPTLALAKTKAALLICNPSPVLSALQRKVLEFLCTTTRSSRGPIKSVTRAGDGTLEALLHLDLIRVTTAGARGAIYHLTDLGRASILCAVNTESEGGPTMTEIEILDADAPAPATEPEAAPAAAKRTRGQKDGELANVAAAPKPKTPTGPSPEMKKLYKDTVTAVKAVAGRGAKTAEKMKYLRIGDSNGKTVAYVNFPTSKSVLVEVPRVTSGYDNVAVKTDADVEQAVAAVTAYITARTEAAAAKAAAAA